MTRSVKLLAALTVFLMMELMMEKTVIAGFVDAGAIVADRMKRLDGAQDHSDTMPMEATKGYPVPVFMDGELWFATPYFLSRGRPPNPPKLSSFGWVMWIDVSTGEQIQIKPLENDLSVEVGERKLDPSIKMKEFRALESQLFAATAKLLEVAKNPGKKFTADEVEAAEIYRIAWQKIAHKPLAEQYYALNPQWFDALGIKP